MEPMNKTINVGMADFKTAQAPDELITLGLGSCVGVILYDEDKKIAGMAHVMLPDSTVFATVLNKAKYADTAIDELIQELLKKGCVLSNLKAKIAGGARMLNITVSEGKSIGDKNIEAVKTILSNKQIPIIAEDVGLSNGRTITFNIEKSQLKIKKIGKGIEVI